MAKDYIDIGPTPAAENSVQVTKNEYYLDKMRAQCERYREMLKAKFADCTKVNLKVRTSQHEFGPYAEVVAEYDGNDEIALAQAIHIQDNVPQYWTDTQPIKFEYEAEDYYE